MTALTSGYAKFSYRPRLGKIAGVETVWYGESNEGCECVGKNRCTPYYRKPEEIDRLHRILAVLRSKHIDSTLAAVDSGIGPLGCAIFSLTPVKARKAMLKIAQQEIDGTAQL